MQWETERRRSVAPDEASLASALTGGSTIKLLSSQIPFFEGS